MKILDIKLKNLNSLRGEWHIDLSSSSYVTDGIFAITGPTGAGKTTIFDAICLALYAQTPRLGKITGTSNEIMSKHTRECYAEVIFEAGWKKYKSLWRQLKDSKGKLQAARHEIHDLDRNKIISEIAKEIPAIIEKITGMSFRQFTQAIMLEQGKFDAFLKAKEKERSQILETLTGTEIYGTISTNVFLRTADEESKLAKIQQELDSKKPRDRFRSIEEISQLLKQTQEAFTLANKEFQKRKEALNWLKNIKKLKYELAQIEDDIRQNQKRRDEFTHKRNILYAAQKANEIAEDFAALLSKREQTESAQKRCNETEQKIFYFKHELEQIETEKLPEITAKLEKLTGNLTDTPEIIYAQAKAKLENYKQTAKRKIDIARKKSQIEIEQQKAHEVFQATEKEYKICLAHYEQIVLSNARTRLKPGEPCPVCGSKEHPGIIHENSEAHSEDFTANFDKVSKKFDEAQKEALEANSKLAQCIDELNKNADETLQAREAVLKIINMMGIFDAGIKSCGEILSKIEKWNSEVKALNNAKNSLTQQREILSAEINSMNENLMNEKANLEVLSGECTKIEADFKLKLTEKGFASEENFKNARISNDEFIKLQNTAKYHDDESARLSGIKSDRTARLNLEQEKSLTTKTLEQLQPEHDEQEKKLNAQQRFIYELENALEMRRTLQEEIDKITAELNRQKIIYDNWAALNKLIGQKDGGKFRVFAQRITLEMMIGLANKQLERMSGRYKLIATPDDEGLALSVIDSEQAGEIRPTKNLSGGESFIVSLALALGLSQISGSKARVDSLFLDEGFGSLDDETLNTALDALGEVKREGRMIGIISHVQALKERIAAQIQVIPKSEGVSIIEGAGCYKL